MLLIGFLALERRVEHPLLPLHIVWDRARGGAYATIALAGSAVFAVFLFLTYYLQQNLGYSPLKTGLAFLPMTAMIVLTATTVQTRMLHRTGARPLVMAGMTLGVTRDAAVHPAVAARAPTSPTCCPALLLTGVGMGCIFAPAFSTATLGVKSSDAGIASAMVNTSQQVGGSVGTALLSTIFASAAASFASSHAGPPRSPGAAAIHGYTTAFEWAAALFAAGLLVAIFVLPRDGAARAAAANAQAASDLKLSLETA